MKLAADNVLVTKGYVKSLELDSDLYVLKTGDYMDGALYITPDASNDDNIEDNPNTAITIDGTNLVAKKGPVTDIGLNSTSTNDV